MVRRREDVAAIGRDVDPRLVDHDLPEQEIDVAALPSHRETIAILLVRG